MQQQQIRPESRNSSGQALLRADPRSVLPPLVGRVPVDRGPRSLDSVQAMQQTSVRPTSQKLDDEETPPSRQLWVGNVSQNTSEALLVENFSKYGKIENVALYPHRNYAFVEFKSLQEAKDAKVGLQGRLLAGNALRIEFAKPAKPSRHLWIGGVGLSVMKEQLEAEFQKFGVLEDFKLLRDRNCAIAEFQKLEDAVAAVKGFSKRCAGNEELRVDFLRSQPLKRENGPVLQSLHADMALGSHSGMGIQDPVRGLLDMSRVSLVSQSKFQQTGAATVVQPPHYGDQKREREGEPSEVLWIGFPPSVRIDEERLRRAFILFGEVERIKMFPGRNYCLVQFRNADEASRAKEGLQGRLFNDPRVQIRFSNGEMGLMGTSKGDGVFLTLPASREVPVHAEFAVPRILISGAERLGPGSPRLPSGMTGLHPGLQHDGRGRGTLLCVGRDSGAGPSIELGSGTLGRGSGPALGARTSFHHPEMQVSGRGGKGLGSYGPTPNTRQAGQIAINGWNMAAEKDTTQREPKRPKLRGLFPAEGLNEAEPSNSHYDLQQGVPGMARGVYEISKPVLVSDRGNQRLDSEAKLPLGPSHVDGSGLEMIASGPVVHGHSSMSRGQGKPLDKYKWQGVIAKAGTVVCRAVGFPVGKGIDTPLPDVINCFARTDLDMLAEHFYQAMDFGVVCFMPDGDSESGCYRDFVRYLGEKHRAGVAKLKDGTTFFLVPPSEFSEKVLKLHGDYLFGVVLKSPQLGTLLPLHQQPPPLVKEHQQFHPQPKPAANEGPFGFLRDELSGHLKSSFSFQARQNPLPLITDQPSSGHSATLSLTPELIASLTALLPQHSQNSSKQMGDSLVASVSGPVAGVLSMIPELKHGAAHFGDGLTSSSSRPEFRTLEASSTSLPRVSPESGGYGPSITREFLKENLPHQLQTISHQPTALLLNGISLAHSHRPPFPISGPNVVPQQSLRLSGETRELPAADTSQVAFVQHQQQPPGMQQDAHLLQHQTSSVAQILSSPGSGHVASSAFQSEAEAPFQTGQLPSSQNVQQAHFSGPISSQGGNMGGASEQVIVSTQNEVKGDLEIEKQNRFQATLQLAAALLQRMHHQGMPQGSESQQ